MTKIPSYFAYLDLLWLSFIMILTSRVASANYVDPFWVSKSTRQVNYFALTHLLALLGTRTKAQENALAQLVINIKRINDEDLSHYFCNESTAQPKVCE